jgi:hypothetical protein
MNATMIFTTRRFVLQLVVLFAIITGVLAWNANFFSFEPEIIEPGENALEIQGVDIEVEEQLRLELVLSGFIKKGDKFVAIINDQIVETDEIVVITLQKTEYSLVVKSVSAEQIVFYVRDIAA